MSMESHEEFEGRESLEQSGWNPVENLAAWEQWSGRSKPVSMYPPPGLTTGKQIQKQAQQRHQTNKQTRNPVENFLPGNNGAAGANPSACILLSSQPSKQTSKRTNKMYKQSKGITTTNKQTPACRSKPVSMNPPLSLTNTRKQGSKQKNESTNFTRQRQKTNSKGEDKCRKHTKANK